MASDIDICNMALAKLGSAPIVSLTENSPKAALLLRTYGLYRDKLQRIFKWSFAMTYAEQPVLTTTPLFEYNYAYSLPANCLRLDLVDVSFTKSFNNVGMPGVNLSDLNTGRSQDYRVVGRQIYTNVPPPLRIQYGAQVTDPTQFDAAFCEALACYLAWQCCEQITGGAQRKKDAAQEYQMSMREARMANAVELAPETIPDDTLMASRRSS